MVREIKCECEERMEAKIDSYTLFQEIKAFFEGEVEKGIYQDTPVQIPYYTGYSELKNDKIPWYATKWYKCNDCGCLWEFNYPDFPAQGFVRKFVNGKYLPQ